MTAIIVFRENPASYVVVIYGGDKLVAQLTDLSVARLRERVKTVYGIDCE